MVQTQISRPAAARGCSLRRPRRGWTVSRELTRSCRQEASAAGHTASSYGGASVLSTRQPASPDRVVRRAARRKLQCRGSATQLGCRAHPSLPVSCGWAGRVGLPSCEGRHQYGKGGSGAVHS